MRKFIAAVICCLCAGSVGASIPLEPAEGVDEGTYYQCRLYFNRLGELVEACTRISKSEPANPEEQLAAVYAAFQMRLPFSPSSFTEVNAPGKVCEIRIDSDCCKVKLILPDGSVIIECD